MTSDHSSVNNIMDLVRTRQGYLVNSQRLMTPAFRGFTPRSKGLAIIMDHFHPMGMHCMHDDFLVTEWKPFIKGWFEEEKVKQFSFFSPSFRCVTPII